MPIDTEVGETMACDRLAYCGIGRLPREDFQDMPARRFATKVI